jgi:hypothetical protein
MLPTIGNDCQLLTGLCADVTDIGFSPGKPVDLGTGLASLLKQYNTPQDSRRPSRLSVEAWTVWFVSGLLAYA